jgi:ATP-dependent protease HslVU (ClpYQ) peptidase subunit
LPVKPPPPGDARMTAEVAIINRQGIALAADSAVTIGRDRVWKHANKLFSAGPRNDIGVMIYNTGDFIGIPWEIVVKEHRIHCSRDDQFDKVKDFADNFISYIKSDKIKNTKGEKRRFAYIIIDVIQNIKHKIKYASRAEFYRELPSHLDKAIKEVEKVDDLECSITFEEFKNRYHAIIKSLAKVTFKHLPKPTSIDKITKLIFTHVCKKYMSQYHSGVVIAGYGRSEMFPSVFHYIVDGKDMGFTRIWSDREWDLNKGEPSTAIIPFAQSDMLYLFIEGILKDYIKFISIAFADLLRRKVEDVVRKLLTSKLAISKAKKDHSADIWSLVEEFNKEFQKYRKDELITPIVETVRSFPKEEMATLAEALVELTALKRKIDSSLETVGGPIDVAVISKGDGFIWINRKHYFDLDFNADFLNRKRLCLGEKP